MGSFKCDEYVEHHPVGSTHTSSATEGFFIEELSDFSNEELAAPIKSDYDSPLQQHSDENSASTGKSECTTTAAAAAAAAATHTSSSPASDLLEDSALEFKAALLSEFHDSSLSLPCQDETGFEWLTSLGEDDLIHNGPNFGVADSFLLSNAEPFGDYDLMMKHGEYEDVIRVRDINMGQNCISTTAAGSRSARSKRARSSGWSSSSILCDRWPESPSPTDSLGSTSQILMPPAGPQYSNVHSLIYKQEEGYTTPSHGNMEVNFTSRLLGTPALCDSPSKGGKFSSSKQWPKEEDSTTREESVSNYGSGLQTRRCTHCLSQKTPQWRAGSEGPKTLCNACGVRYKSGRLFNEYRPAKSPTFLSYKHSNSHKKVMEMRRRKTFHYNQQQQQYTAHHHVRAPALAKHTDGSNQHLISKFKVKLNNSPYSTELPSTQFSDVTLISTRNALESPSSFLY
ncbi:hypothetical protein GOP47_0028225 [Adiantum capillus-veneris]|nr:hypothetical protein GOP47_0028225 [Adiantum capillus-veneris]